MRLVTYQHEGQSRIGAQLDGLIVDLNRAYRAGLRHVGNDDELAVANLRVPGDMIGLLSGGGASFRATEQAVAFFQEQPSAGDKDLPLQGIVYAPDQVSLLSPLLRPRKITFL